METCPLCVCRLAGPHCADGRAGQRLYCWPCRHARPHPVGKHAAVCLGGAHQVREEHTWPNLMGMTRSGKCLHLATPL
eukprot:1156355-Pelagomonas_calceolata.AAC.6